MTGRDLVTASHRLLGILASGESLGASEAADAISSLNRMLSSWRTEPLMGLEAFTDAIELDTEISMPDGCEDAMIYNLSVRLGPEYGKAVSPDIAALAIEYKANVKRANSAPPVLEVDAALLVTGRISDIESGEA